MSYSLNAPLPPAVERLAAALRADFPEGVRPRERPTLVAKRIDRSEGADPGRLLARARGALEVGDSGPVEARTDALGTFEFSTGPVVHLIVGGGLRRLHCRLCRAFDPVGGAAYVPHVTPGRGGDPDAVAAFCERSVDPVAWTVDRLVLRSGRYREPVAGLSLS